MASLPQSFTVPLRDKLLDGDSITAPWEWFFRKVWERLNPLGEERSFPIVNNQASAANIDGLKFDSRYVAQALVEFLVVRVTTGTGATELVESGLFIVVFKPTSNAWAINLVNINSPQNSGVDFTVTSAGQARYTSSNITGTASISTLHYRVRTLSGKHSSYSSMRGGR